MARRLSWLHRIDAIARSIAQSSRSHYECSDIERVFGLKQRSAQVLMRSLPTVAVGRTKLVEQHTLSKFLERLMNSEDPAKEFAAVRAGKGTPIRRKLRRLVRDDVATDIGSLPSSIRLSKGELHVSFKTVDELGEALLALAGVFTLQLDQFAVLYEPATEAMAPEEQAEFEAQLADAEFIKTWLR